MKKVKKYINIYIIRSYRGSVLVLSIWIVMFLSIIGFICGTVVKQQILFFKNIEMRIKKYDVVSSGVVYGIETVRTYFADNKNDKIDTFNDYWKNNPALFHSIKFSDTESFTIFHERMNGITKKKERIYGVEDEESKLNINYVDVDTLTRLIQYASGIGTNNSKKIAVNIVDWRDPDDIKGDGKTYMSESIDYHNKGYPYVPRNLPFDTLEELLLVKEMNANIYNSISGYLTVYGDGRVNINTASQAVFLSMGLSWDLTEKIVLYRCGNDMIEGTGDDRIFGNVKGIIKDLSMYFELTKNEKDKLTDLIFMNILNTRSAYMKIICISDDVPGKFAAEVVCIFNKTGDIKYWAHRYLTL